MSDLERENQALAEARTACGVLESREVALAGSIAAAEHRLNEITAAADRKLIDAREKQDALVAATRAALDAATAEAKTTRAEVVTHFETVKKALETEITNLLEQRGRAAADLAAIVDRVDQLRKAIAAL